MLLGGGLISLSKLNLGDECKRVPEIISREVVEALLRNRRALGSALDYVKGKAYITGGLCAHHVGWAAINHCAHQMVGNDHE